MRKIFISLIIFAGFYSFAQEAGKVGELLKNEASKNEMQTQRNENLGKRNEGINNSNYRNRNSVRNNQNDQNERLKNPNYNWNQNYNYGYAEVFLRIPERGNFMVEVGDQMSSNNSGKYRFFDLLPGFVPILIYENGYLIYRSRINVRNNSRLILDFFSNQGLYLLQSYPLQSMTNGNYGDVWNDVWNSPYGGNSGQWDPVYGTGQGNFNGNVMNNNIFSSFLKAVKNANFDDNKVSVIRQQLRNSMITSEQVKALLKMLSFDGNRLEVAKYAYSRCVDPANYFEVYSAFQFESTAKELRDYISNQ